MILMEMVLGYFGPVITVMLWIITALATWRVFIKAGLPGWKAMIPGYREYNIFAIAWSRKKFWIYAAFACAAAVFEVAAGANGEGSVIGLIGSVVDLVVIYYEVFVKIKLAKAFGRGRIFGLVLYFVEVIGMTGLGFGPEEYIGPEGKK